MEKPIRLINDRPSDSGKRYIVYKRDIHHYRILDSYTGELIEGNFRCLTIKNPSFRVDIGRYNAAKEVHFINDNNPKSFFAWIEADEVSEGVLFQAPNQIKFNPFVGSVFYGVDSNTSVYEAEVCTILGNELYIV